MKINKKFIQTFIFILVYLFGIYFWSQPYQERNLPYGEYDAMSHFEIADYMAYNDKSFMELPPYIDLRYGGDNEFKPHVLWYHPTFHASLGVIEVVGGERVLPVFLMNTILATFIIISVYFVINSLFGFWPAILSSLLLIFSPRDFLPFLWGQWPERFGYAFLPLILYCFYKYYTTYSKKDSKPIYMYLLAFLLGINVLVHPLSFFHTAVGLVVLFVLLFIKDRKIPFNLNHIGIAAVIFIVLLGIFPYQTGNIFSQFARGGENTDVGLKMNIARLFQWSPNAEDFAGSVPAFYFSFKDMHGLWTLPFLLFGILFLAIRRERRDLFLLAWLISLYFVMHRDMVGKIMFLHRSLSATAHIFIPLTAIGAVSISSFLKIPKVYKKYLKYTILVLFIYLTFSVNKEYASNLLDKDSYNPYSQSGFFTSLNQAEVDANDWIMKNVPDKSINVTIIGVPYGDNVVSATSKKIRWSAAISQHVTRFYYFLEDKNATLREFYIMMDYTMLGPLNDQKTFEEMQLFEKNVLINHTLLYDQDGIRVYKNEN